jgi:glutaminase
VNRITDVASPLVPSFSQSELNQWALTARQESSQGHLPTYIPRLAIAPPQAFAAEIHAVTGEVYAVGEVECQFPLMSVIKPFIFLYLLERWGTAQVLAHVGIQPSALPFNALEQLQQDGGFPRNPLINSGAIALAALLPGATPAIACGELQTWLNQQAGCELTLDQEMLASVQSVRNPRNWAIAQELHRTGHLARSVEMSLAIYEQVCCLAGTVADLARLGLLLVNPASPLAAVHRQQVQTVMATCGLYEQSEHFMQTVGLPAKSGVSGALLALVRNGGAIACYGPPLDATGNSVAGMAFIRQVAANLNSRSAFEEGLKP